MLVNSHQYPGPAMWQGLMLIVVTIWAILLQDKKTKKYANVFLVAATIAVSVLVAII